MLRKKNLNFPRHSPQLCRPHLEVFSVGHHFKRVPASPSKDERGHSFFSHNRSQKAAPCLRPVLARNLKIVLGAVRGASTGRSAFGSRAFSPVFRLRPEAGPFTWGADMADCRIAVFEHHRTAREAVEAEFETQRSCNPLIYYSLLRQSAPPAPLDPSISVCTLDLVQAGMAWRSRFYQDGKHEMGCFSSDSLSLPFHCGEELFPKYEQATRFSTLCSVGGGSMRRMAMTDHHIIH